MIHYIGNAKKRFADTSNSEKRGRRGMRMNNQSLYDRHLGEIDANGCDGFREEVSIKTTFLDIKANCRCQ